jgi:hypothetical protein
VPIIYASGVYVLHDVCCEVFCFAEEGLSSLLLLLLLSYTLPQSFLRDLEQSFYDAKTII